MLEEVALELGCKSLVRWKGRRVAFQVGKQNDERPMGRNEYGIFQEVR